MPLNKKLKLKLIREAQEHLVKNPSDPAHDLTHAHRVWLEAEALQKSIKLPIDTDVLELMCWWHDVLVLDYGNQKKRVAERTADYLATKFTGQEKKIIYDSLLNHEFGKKPKFTEGKILQDADKLDVLSLERVKTIAEAIEVGAYPREKAQLALNQIMNNWLPKMLKRYNFKKAKQSHKEREPLFIKQIDILKKKFKMN